MKKILALILLVGISLNAQEKEKGKFFKDIYKELFKYSTIYTAGDLRNSYEPSRKQYYVERPAEGDLYAIPEVVDVTEYHDYDYRIGVGIRKLARFQYERKPKNYYDGTENQLAFSAPTSALDGLEYQFHWERERERSEEFDNHRYFLKYTGPYWIVKAESRKVGKINLSYQSAEVRARLPIGKKLSISAGAIYRTHERTYGYNPVEIWLNETNTYTDGSGNEVDYPANPWYTLGFLYGYDDVYYSSEYTDPATGQTMTDNDWMWIDPDGVTVAYTDLDFRQNVFPNLMNRYNNEIWDTIDPFGEIAPIVGLDFYHYKSKFWLHAYANWILPYHKYITGDENFSYLNRNNWGRGGIMEDSELEQWDDYQGGINLGWKIGRNLGVFVEGEYAKMWDSELFNTSVGLNYTFK